jgi:hypothetical protein
MCMLRVQPRVPVYTGEIERETTVGFNLCCMISNQRAERKVENGRVRRRSLALLLKAPS